MVHVQDEAGGPIPGAHVSVVWSSGVAGGFGSGREMSLKLITDDAGMVKLNLSHVANIASSKEGFYYNGIANVSPSSGPLVIVLEKKINPHPMYVRRIDMPRGTVPAESLASCGFDLVKGDWVAPGHVGETADCIVSMRYDVRGERDLDFRSCLTFPNPGDGLILFSRPLRTRRNELRLPAVAPEKGYLNMFSWSGVTGASNPTYANAEDIHNQKSRNAEDDNYIFRIRSRIVDGTVVSARYGKIHGRIQADIGPLSGIKTKEDALPQIRFLYYVNADDSKDLEWDAVHNLAPGEEVNPEP
jgi:hypothetical protein